MSDRRNRILWKTCSLACLALLAAIWLGGGDLVAARLEAWLAPRPAVGGPFELIATTGETVTEADLEGTPTAIFFGYTNCPDVCPTTLYEASNWLGELGADAERIRILFVTVDPMRDTPEHLASYMSAFDDRIVGLTGSADAVRQMVKAYGAYAERAGGQGGDDYLVDHTSAVYLLDDEGRFVDTIAYQEPAAEALSKLRFLIRAG
jgi:protein SCO1